MNEREQFEPRYSPQYLMWKTDFIAKNNGYPTLYEAWQAALRQRGEGMVLVPVEPTPERVHAAWLALAGNADLAHIREAYKALIAAKP